jgi:hypothetical protein
MKRILVPTDIHLTSSGQGRLCDDAITAMMEWLAPADTAD